MSCYMSYSIFTVCAHVHGKKEGTEFFLVMQVYSRRINQALTWAQSKINFYKNYIFCNLNLIAL